MASAYYEYNKDHRFRNDEVIKKVNTFVSLEREDKKENTFHLEQVLNKGLIPLMRRQDSFFNSLFNSLMYGGSYYKGTKVGKADEYDVHLIFSLPWRQDTLKFETPEKKPGFIKIQLSEDSKLPVWQSYR